MIASKLPGPLPHISVKNRSPLNSDLAGVGNRNQSNLSPTGRFKTNKSVFGVNLVYMKAKEEID